LNEIVNPEVSSCSMPRPACRQVLRLTAQHDNNISKFELLTATQLKPHFFYFVRFINSRILYTK
jgi:hypothetical protein